MDPNRLLADVRKSMEMGAEALAWDSSGVPVYDINELIHALGELISNVGELDQWMTDGGFKPTAWEKKATEPFEHSQWF